jgi:hypothetical protein
LKRVWHCEQETIKDSRQYQGPAIRPVWVRSADAALQQT